MDDIKMIKELRRFTPEMSAAAEAAVRDRIAALADPAPSRPLVTRGRALRAGLAGALTVTVVGGITVIPDDGGPSMRPASAEAAEFGDRAARTVEGQPNRPPRPNQWIYWKSMYAEGGDAMHYWWKGGLNPKKFETREGWERVDGTAEAWLDKGKLRVVRLGSGRPQPSDEFPTLPRQPRALLRYLYEPRIQPPMAERKARPQGAGPSVATVGPDRGPVTDESVFDTLRDILERPLLPPALRAAIYRALPLVPGVTLQRDVADAAGRRGTAFTFVTRIGERESIILDPTGHHLLGGRTDVVRERTEKVGDKTVTVKVGTVLACKAYLEQRVVDKAGQRR